MARSARKTVAVPNPIRDGLNHQIENGTLSYASENAAWVGLARYQLIVGKPHPLTEAIARMPQQEQDLIDDYLCHVAQSGESLKGQLLAKMIRDAVDGSEDPTGQDIQSLLPEQLLKMAKQWRAAL